MSNLRRVQALVRTIISSGKEAEEIARGHRRFGDPARDACDAMDELKSLSVPQEHRERLARRLQRQGETMTLAMVLGGYLCNAAKAVRAGPQPLKKPNRAPEPPA